jgi:rhodanese-related sulfurtransferase
MSVQALWKRLDRGEPVTVLDVRQREAAAADSRRLPGAVVMRPDDVAERWSELPKERDVVAYCT